LLVAVASLVLPLFQAAGADASARPARYSIVTIGVPPGFTVASSYLNDRGEVAGTLEDVAAGEITAFVFKGQRLAQLGAPKGFGLSIGLGIAKSGTVLVLAFTDIAEAPVPYVAVPKGTGYRWRKLPFNPLRGDCRPLMAADGDITGGTAAVPCALWPRRANGTYGRLVKLAASPGYDEEGLSAIWTSGSRFVAGGAQQSTVMRPSIWSPTPSLQGNAGGVITGLGGTPAHLFTVGMDSAGAVYGQLGFDAHDVAHLGRLRTLRGPPSWGNVLAMGVTTDATGKMIAVGDGTPATGKAQPKALIWHGTRAALLQSGLPPATGWVLSAAKAINGSGQILGTGDFQGKQSTYLMTPLK
jgi:hypothetical protein